MVLRLAAISGILGASASCFAKFAFAADSPVVEWTDNFCRNRWESTIIVSEPSVTLCDVLPWVPRCMCLLGVVLMNVLMVGAFLEGMKESGSVAGTALSSAANFGASAVYGVLLWNESVNLTWLLGFALVLAGATLLSTVQSSSSSHAVHEKKKS